MKAAIASTKYKIPISAIENLCTVENNVYKYGAFAHIAARVNIYAIK